MTAAEQPGGVRGAPPRVHPVGGSRPVCPKHEIYS